MAYTHAPGIQSFEAVRGVRLVSRALRNWWDRGWPGVGRVGIACGVGLWPASKVLKLCVVSGWSRMHSGTGGVGVGPWGSGQHPKFRSFAWCQAGLT
eukprot:15477142-Alexandrium_andersonii.AAC.2